jgi:hypothetical protein
MNNDIIYRDILISKMKSMRTVLLFLLFLLIGFTIVGGYRYITFTQKSLPEIVPTIATEFSLKNAPSESLLGTIASMSGTVKWLSRTADKSVKLTAPRSIQQGETLSTGKNGQAIVTIKNDSLINIAPDTDISFVQLLPINFVIEQDKGTVLYTNSQQVPISVRSFGMITIIDKGVVRIEADDKDKTITVTVTKGNVNAGFVDTQYNSNAVTVNAGEQYVFDDKTRQGTITQLPGVIAPKPLPFGQ